MAGIQVSRRLEIDFDDLEHQLLYLIVTFEQIFEYVDNILEELKAHIVNLTFHIL